MQQAIDFEIRWQIEEIEDGRAIQQATVLFDPDTGETRAMRTKEDAADYRYFPDPDLPPLAIAQEWVERVRGEMPELPRAMAERYVTTTACRHTTRRSSRRAWRWRITSMRRWRRARRPSWPATGSPGRFATPERTGHRDHRGARLGGAAGEADRAHR
jgi:hypothetical protein